MDFKVLVEKIPILGTASQELKKEEISILGKPSQELQVNNNKLYVLHY